ncbi:hypothetical protein FQN55_005499 [Onygenales sp. PD_40]|nr:hypothetical protein FQN55_005499 [Onygenales sp. PD_40]KAK2781481.1 hypothetical protein FQN53_000572 [Emmonsiellopsis sp. PD_33]KAK2790368.1 hypothetical protein FQN52_005636 [Onygenales sp. PD_12]
MNNATRYNMPGPPPSSNTSAEYAPANSINKTLLACAIAGSIAGTALLTLLIACIVFRRWKSSKGFWGPNADSRGDERSTTPLNNTLPPPRRSGDKATLLDQKQNHEAISLSSYVPHPAEDQTVKDRVLAVFDQVALHAENYYAPSSISILGVSLLPETKASISLYDSPCLPASVISLLEEPKNQISIIKHCLIRTVLPGIIPGFEFPLLPGRPSFLPLPYTAYQQRQKSLPDAKIDQPLFYWRMLTGYMQRRLPTPEQDTYSASRNEHTKSIAEAFASTFAPYASSQYSEVERTRHLTSLIEAAADLEMYLFSQPCGFEFVWQSPRTDESVIVPGLTKVSDENGCRLADDQIMVSPATTSL